MEIIGIIAEYNPFHYGHLYHIEKIKELYPDSLLVLVLNGYFTERGEVSILSKEDKVSIVLQNTVDIVLELPFIYGTQSADTFAYQSINILNAFKVNRIIFGSESNNIDQLENIAKRQMENDYNELVVKYLDEGINYPTALAKAINTDFDFNNPNDLLAISYIKAITSINSSIKYECIKRTNDYHDTLSNTKVVSASNIRKKYYENIDVSNYIPYNRDYLIKCNYELLFTLLKHKILTDNNLDRYLSVDEGIENRLQKQIVNCNNLDDFITSIKTKRYTYNKINRMLIHILVGLEKKDNESSLYIKILGFNNRGQEYINSIKKSLVIDNSENIKSIELKASYIYEMLTNKNTSFETSNKPIINN